MDIDKDGAISDIDMETFLLRGRYLEKNEELFPNEEVEEIKANVILNDLKEELCAKKISFADFLRVYFY